MDLNVKRSTRNLLIAILLSSTSALATLPAAAGLISLNFGSTINLGGIETAVEGNFLLDTDFPLSDGFNDNALFGGSLMVGGQEFGPPMAGLFTSLYFENTAPGIVGLSIFAENSDTDTFWSLDMFFEGQTNAAGLYDFLLSGITESDLVGASGGGLFDPFVLVNLSGSSIITSEIESFSVSVVGVPEPGALALVGIGALMLLARRRLA